MHDWRFATVRDSTADELGARLRNLLALRDLTLRRPRRLDPLLDGAAAAAGVDGDGGALPRPRDARRRARACAPACRSAWTTRARSARTGSSTPSRPTSASAAPCVVVDFGTAITYDVVARGGRVRRRHHRPGRRDLDGGADAARRGDPADRPHAAAHADRQVDRRGDPLRRHLRLRRPGRRHASRGCGDELGDDIEAIATGGLAGAIVPFCEKIDDVDPLLTLKGLRLIWQRNPVTSPKASAATPDERLAWQAKLPFDPYALACTTPGSSAGSRSRTGSCSRRWPASATGSCASRPSATAPGSRSREMVSSHAIHYGNRKTLDELLVVHPDERAGGPVAIQLFGQDPDDHALRRGRRGRARRRPDRPQHGLPGPQGHEDRRGRGADQRTPTRPSRSRAPRARAPASPSPSSCAPRSSRAGSRASRSRAGSSRTPASPG